MWPRRCNGPDDCPRSAVFQVAAQVIDGLSAVFRRLRQVDVPVLAASGQYQTVPVAFTEDGASCGGIVSCESGCPSR
nr:hypothetical protein pPsy0462a_00031 [Pseudomonas syringae]